MKFLSGICNTLLNWLVRKEKDEEDFNSELRVYFVIASKLGLIVGIFLLIFGLSTLVDWPYEVNVEALASYVGTLLAAIVAFAGSIVAIKLSLQAIKITEEQNRHSITQRPEYTEGLNAALAYARFKGILLLLPFQMRTLQKRNALNSMELASGADDTKSIEGLTKHLEELLNTTFITVFDRVAKKSAPYGAGDDKQYLFLNRFSVLQSRKNLLRGVRLGLIMQREVDDIVRDIYEKPFKHLTTNQTNTSLKDFEEFEDYSVAYDIFANHSDLKLNEIEFWFVKHVYPYVVSKQKITYDDFKYLVDKARKSLSAFTFKHFDGHQDSKIQDLKLFSEDSKECKMVVGLEDSSLFQLVSYNRNLFQNQTFTRRDVDELDNDILKEDGVIQIILSQAWDTQLALLLSGLASGFDIKEPKFDGKLDRKAKIIVLFDQVGLYKDYYERKKHFLLSDHLLMWKFFNALNRLIMVSEAQIPNVEVLFNVHYSEKFLEIIASAARKVLGDEQLNALDEAANNELLHTSWSDNLIYKLRDIANGELTLDFDAEQMKLIEHLSLSPLFERPFYVLQIPTGFGYSRIPTGFGYSRIPEEMPNNIEFMAYATFDEDARTGELVWPDNIFVEWLMHAPKNKEGNYKKEIYWIDKI